jgi:hypothetical protein
LLKGYLNLDYVKVTQNYISKIGWYQDKGTGVPPSPWSTAKAAACNPSYNNPYPSSSPVPTSPAATPSSPPPSCQPNAPNAYSLLPAKPTPWTPSWIPAGTIFATLTQTTSSKCSIPASQSLCPRTSTSGGSNTRSCICFTPGLSISFYLNRGC